jgi:hypothetical protein
MEGGEALILGKPLRGRHLLTTFERRDLLSPPVITVVGTHQFPEFNLLEQIIDLLKLGLFNDVANICVNLSPDKQFSTFKARTAADCFVEVFASRWYRSTDKESIKDHDLEFLLPLVFYIDETGTDVFQWYHTRTPNVHLSPDL